MPEKWGHVLRRECPVLSKWHRFTCSVQADGPYGWSGHSRAAMLLPSPTSGCTACPTASRTSFHVSPPATHPALPSLHPHPKGRAGGQPFTHPLSCHVSVGCTHPQVLPPLRGGQPYIHPQVLLLWPIFTPVPALTQSRGAQGPAVREILAHPHTQGCNPQEGEEEEEETEAQRAPLLPQHHGSRGASPLPGSWALLGPSAVGCPCKRV